ncbi:MAG: peptidoglycan-binding protein [Planctomycetota bacterium]
MSELHGEFNDPAAGLAPGAGPSGRVVGVGNPVDGALLDDRGPSVRSAASPPAQGAAMAPGARTGAGMRPDPAGGRSSLQQALESQKRRMNNDHEEASREDAEYEDAQPTTPSGSGDWAVRDGDCFSRIAHESGHLLETIANEPTNAELLSLRTNPHVLLPGDQVTVPPIRQKAEPAETERRNRFVKRGSPSMLRLVLKRNDEPRANESYTLVIDGETFDGTTDAEGKIERAISPDAKKGILNLENEDTEYEVQLGHLDPVQSLRGIRQRLTNLGFACDDGSDDEDDASELVRQAIVEFQRMRGLDATGNIDDVTREALVGDHGS